MLLYVLRIVRLQKVISPELFEVRISFFMSRNPL